MISSALLAEAGATSGKTAFRRSYEERPSRETCLGGKAVDIGANMSRAIALGTVASSWGDSLCQKEHREAVRRSSNPFCCASVSSLLRWKQCRCILELGS